MRGDRIPRQPNATLARPWRPSGVVFPSFKGSCRVRSALREATGRMLAWPLLVVTAFLTSLASAQSELPEGIERLRAQALQARAQALETKRKAETAIAAADRALAAAARERKPDLEARARQLRDENKMRAAEAEERLRQITTWFDELKRCEEVGTQLQRDLEAVRRQQRTIAQGQRELEEWTRRNEQAQWNAILTAVNLLSSGLLAYSAETDRVINGLQGAITRYENQLRRQGKRIDQFQMAKLMDLNKRKLELTTAADAARGLQKAKKEVQLTWHFFTREAKLADEKIESVQDTLRVIGDDPLFKELLKKEGLQPLVGKMQTYQVFPKKPYLVEFSSFLVDYGYHATAWMESRDRILQQYNLADEQLKAVNALKEQVELTMKRLKECQDAMAARLKNLGPGPV